MESILMVSKVSRRVSFCFAFRTLPMLSLSSPIVHGPFSLPSWFFSTGLVTFMSQMTKHCGSQFGLRSLVFLCLVGLSCKPLLSLLAKLFALSQTNFLMLTLKRGFALRLTFHMTWRKLLISKWEAIPSPRRCFIWIFPTLFIGASQRNTRSGIVPWLFQKYNPLLWSSALDLWRELRRMNGPL